MLEVTNWYYSDPYVVVEYSDGHIGYYEPYRNWDQVEGFRTFMLKRGKEKIFVYRGRESRHSFVSAVIFQVSGISQQYAATYWELASKYFNVYYEANQDPHMWSAWLTCHSESGMHLDRLRQGTANLKLHDHD